MIHQLVIAGGQSGRIARHRERDADIRLTFLMDRLAVHLEFGARRISGNARGAQVIGR